MIKVVLAEDHQILRDGIKALFKDHPQISIINEASNGEDALKILDETEVDVLIADINMPLMDGIATTEYIKQHHPRTKVLILSMLEHEKYVSQSFEAGAMGYILKTAGKEELINATLKVANGEPYISHKISRALLKRVRLTGGCDNLVDVELSDRELEILSYVAEGYTNAEIADKTFTSKRTVETHRKNLIEKTGAKNTASLIKFAIMSGILK